MFNDKTTFCDELSVSATSGTLVPLKHDAASLSATYPHYRTVLDTSVYSYLDAILATQACDVWRYQNNSYSGNEYYEIAIHTSAGFPIAASGVPAYSNIPTTTADRLVVVPYGDGRYHIFGANSTDIASDPYLVNKTELL